MALTYARAIADGRAPACAYIKAACERYLTMQTREWQAKHGIYFSEEHAVEACAFIETLHHIEGVWAGKPFVIEPWQMWILCSIYGFRWEADGLRVTTTVYAEIPRKNGKSLLAAGIGLYETTVAADKGDHLYIIAPKFDQGLKVLNPIQKMVGYNRHLMADFGIKNTKLKSEVVSTDSDIIVLSAIGEKQDGHNPKIVIADEFHAVPDDLYNVMQSSQRAREESLFLMIGSAGRNCFGTGWNQRRHCIDMLEGKRAQEQWVFAAIYTVDDEDRIKWDGEKALVKASPGAGVSINIRKAMQDVAAAKGDPSKKAEYLRTSLNIWGMGENQLFPVENWERAARPTLQIEQCLSLPCWVGVDLASRNDMVAMSILFARETGDLVPDKDGEGLVADVDLYLFARHFVPESGPWIDDEDMAGPYRAWAESGHLTMTPGSRHDFRGLRRELFGLFDQGFDIQTVVIDDYQANEFFAALQDAGKPVVAYRKSAPNHSDPTKDLMSRVNGREQSLFHDGNPVLAWNFQNVIGATDTRDLILGKKPDRNSSQKIDGFDAAVQANAARLQMVEIKKPSGPQPMAIRGMRIL